MEEWIWYFNDILVHGVNTEREHQAIVQNILQQYVEHILAVILLTSQFYI